MSKIKKPFFQTRIGKAIKGALRELPIVGGAIDNINSPDSGQGKLDKSTAVGQAIIGGVILLAALQGFGVINLPPELLQTILDLF
jgi:hypothetical protein